MPNSKDTPGFSSWSVKFTTYLARETTNKDLKQLLSELGRGGREEIAASIYYYLQTDDWRQFRVERRRTGKEVDKGFSRVIRLLHEAVKEYQKLGQLDPDLPSGTHLGSDAPEGFADHLNAEADRLVEQRKKSRTGVSHKRAGNKSALGILIRLQEFVDEFCRRLGKSLPEGKVRHLSPTDLADLIEAGKSAFGVTDGETFTDVAAIERALQRFRAHPLNAKIYHAIKDDAIKACDRVELGTPMRVSLS